MYIRCFERMFLFFFLCKDLTMSHKTMKLFASAAERNKDPLLEVLKKFVQDKMDVLEIASGTGQHVTYFAKNLPLVNFHPTDIDESSIESIKSYVNEFGLRNIREPDYLDVRMPVENWLNGKLKPESIDCILNINMVHISDFDCTTSLFKGSKYYLKPYGILFMYGPFSMNGVIFPESNVSFNNMLKSKNPSWGLRDVQSDLKPEAEKNNLELMEIIPMPANNHVLIWKKFPSAQ